MKRRRNQLITEGLAITFYWHWSLSLWCIFLGSILKLGLVAAIEVDKFLQDIFTNTSKEINKAVDEFEKKIKFEGNDLF